MIVRHSMHASYLSNAYLVADAPGGTAVIVDTGAPVEPLLAAANELEVKVAYVLNTHDHHDHTLHNIELQERFDAPLRGPAELLSVGSFEVGAMKVRALSTPGHTPEHAAVYVSTPDGETALFSGDVLFRGTVGGTIGCGPEGYELLRRSIMDTLLALPDDTPVYPGHTDPTTLLDEREHNPFIRYWAGEEGTLDEPVQVAGNEATLLIWAPDYDGGNKALVSFPDGLMAIVGGSRVERAGTPA
jgi:glyoxylase-like metal-dependent hydrolase (beta-lactamase superfamily II)